MGFGAEPWEWKKGKKGETWTKTTKRNPPQTLTCSNCRHGKGVSNCIRIGDAMGVQSNALEKKENRTAKAKR
jgi:hypothetical protein